jgi:hypothetical protein
MCYFPPHINLFTEMGHKEPITTIAVAAIDVYLYLEKQISADSAGLTTGRTCQQSLLHGEDLLYNQV